jgi:LysR family transcriptional regulator, transcriptional activator of nhaA
MADLNYHHLRYFWAVAHDGNLTRTADRLNLSQSALSAQIKQLEARIGQALFERRGRGLHLTEAGRIALDHADTIFATGEELLDTLRETSRPARALRVGALSTLSRNFQMAFLEPVLGRTDVEIILRSGSASELYAALDALNIDVLLTNTPPARDAISPYLTQKLADQTVGLFGTPERVTGNAPLEELVAKHPLILPTRETQIRAGFDALLRRVRATPRIAAEVDDMAMIRLLARQGTALAVVPPIVVQDELQRGELKQAAMLDLHELFYAVTLDRRYPNPLLADLMEAAQT